LKIQSAGRLSIRGRIRKNAKRRARIFGVDDAKNPGITGMLSCKESRRAIVHLGDAIESDDNNAIRK
jgi:hypothetical protein